jgi:hypothetical protein
MVWFAVLLIISGFLGDFSNNTKALTGSWMSISVDDTGLIMIAFAIAGSITALAYAAERLHKGFWFGAILALACSSSLTLYAQWGDVESRDQAKTIQSATLPALIAEKDRLLESLPRCEISSWCSSQAKEARIAEINGQLAEMKPETGNPGGPWLAAALLFAVSIGAPICNLFCSAMAARLLNRKDEKTEKRNFANVVDFKKKLLSVQPKTAQPTVQPQTLYSSEEGGKQYSKAKKAVERLHREGKSPSVRNVMAVRDGSKRVAPGRSDEIAGHLRRMHEEGLLIKKGQGYWYADHYVNKKSNSGK